MEGNKSKRNVAESSQQDVAAAFERIEMEGGQPPHPAVDTAERGHQLLHDTGANQPYEHAPMATLQPLPPQEKAGDAHASRQGMQRAPAPGLVSRLPAMQMHGHGQQPLQIAPGGAAAASSKIVITPRQDDRLHERILPSSEGLLDHSARPLRLGRLELESEAQQQGQQQQPPQWESSPSPYLPGSDDLVDGPDLYEEPEPTHIAGAAWERADAALLQQQRQPQRQRQQPQQAPDAAAATASPFSPSSGAEAAAAHAAPGTGSSTPWHSGAAVPNTPPLPMPGVPFASATASSTHADDLNAVLQHAKLEGDEGVQPSFHLPHGDPVAHSSGISGVAGLQQQERVVSTTVTLYQRHQHRHGSPLLVTSHCF